MTKSESMNNGFVNLVKDLLPVIPGEDPGFTARRCPLLTLDARNGSRIQSGITA